MTQSNIPVPDSVAQRHDLKGAIEQIKELNHTVNLRDTLPKPFRRETNKETAEAITNYLEKMSRIEIPQDAWRKINHAKLNELIESRCRPFNRAPIFYKLLKNPLVIDKRGLFLDYMRAFNDVSDIVEYEKPNKYNFNLVSK